MHRWITDECRESKSDAGCIDEVAEDLKEKLASVLHGWRNGGARIHVGITVEDVR
jgi:hypothetical protein